MGRVPCLRRRRANGAGPVSAPISPFLSLLKSPIPLSRVALPCLDSAMPPTHPAPALTLTPPRSMSQRHAAMSGGQVEVASLLILDFKADVTALNKNRKTPIEVAPQPTLDALRREGVL